MNNVSEPFDSKTFLSQLTTQPGVYRMYAEGDALLYVGKARNLKKRVASYFLRASGSPRIERMVDQIRRIEVSVTNTEDQALLLEATLIKELHPRYNVMLRDDKSYPYVRLTEHAFPRLMFYRGPRKGGGRYFGPYPSSQTVRVTLEGLQKMFRLRTCSDSFFEHRRRPCLQYQIQRCSAPCTGLISNTEYQRDLQHAVQMLEGRTEDLAQELGAQMVRESEALAFERAARLRDQIAALKRIQDTRSITGGARELDMVVVAPHAASSCVTVVSVRDGLNLGHRSFFPKHPADLPPEALMEEFIAQYYLDRELPAEILLSHMPDNSDWLEQSLGVHAGRKVHLSRPERGARLRMLEMTQQTAAQALSARLLESASMDARFVELQEALELDEVPQRLECFDISHTRGEKAVASCVVFNCDGALKSAYRKFNIENVTPGDDYAAIQQAVGRRFARIKAGEVPMPDVLFIDGGVGQVHAAMAALDEAGVDNVRIVGIAKGPTRRPGMEELILPERDTALVLPPDSPALHLIQRLRDEAHRFAITGHRGRRDKARVTSGLERIEGLGPARRRALLTTLGGLPQVKRASIDELTKVPGISRALAERIHTHFR